MKLKKYTTKVKTKTNTELNALRNRNEYIHILFLNRNRIYIYMYSRIVSLNNSVIYIKHYLIQIREKTEKVNVLQIRTKTRLRN